jgi:hypothetical protein
MYLFNENMDAKLLQGILGTHLVESAELHFDVEHAEQWWFLRGDSFVGLQRDRQKSGIHFSLLQSILLNE